MAYYYHGGRTMSYGKCYDAHSHGGRPPMMYSNTTTDERYDAHSHGGRPPMMYSNTTTDERYDAHSHGGRPPMMYSNTTTDECYYKKKEEKTHTKVEAGAAALGAGGYAYHEQKEASY